MGTAGRHLSSLEPAILHRPSADELPNVSIEAAEFLLNHEEGAGILDGRANFEPVANDPGIFQQRCNLRFVESGDFARIEAVESGSIGGSFFQNGNPAQTRLSAFQYQEFEEKAVIVYGHAPFFIVVSDQMGIACPGAPLNPRIRLHVSDYTEHSNSRPFRR